MLFREYAALPNNPNWDLLVSRKGKLYSRGDDIRSPFARDYTRILHSMAYRRLKHKTQVFFNIDNDHVCTRMDVKTLSSIIGHVSAATTLDIYSHMTDTMQMQAAINIDRKIGGTDAEMPEVEQTPDQTVKTPQTAKYEPKQPKIRRPGTGCITEINDHLFEGRYSPTNAYGKRTPKNVYAKTREECEEKLAELITQMNLEIAAEKERLKTEHTA